MRTLQTFENIYLKSSSVLLFLTATAKLISASQKASVLAMPDPLMGFVSIRQISIIAGVVEVAVAIYIFSPQNVIAQLKTIAWLSFLFIAYHLGLRVIGFHGMCPCLGDPNAWLKLSDSSINTVVIYLLSYLFLVAFCCLDLIYACKLLLT